MPKKLATWTVIIIAVTGTFMVGLTDWVTGYEMNFFVFFFLPVAIAAWYVGLRAAIAIAVLSALVWYGVSYLSEHSQLSTFNAVWNTINRLIAFILIGWLVAKIRTMLDTERRLTAELSQKLTEIKVLETFLPICCQCKKIRNQEGQWQQLEAYIGEHTGSQFSHGYCPECFQTVMVENDLLDTNKTL